MLLPRDLLARCARNYPDKTAYICGAERRTWRGMDERSARLASALHRLGLQRGDTVAILGRESLVIYEHFFACMKLGLTRLGLNWRYTQDELVHLLRDSGASALLVDAGCIELVAPLLDGLRADGIRLVGYGVGHGLDHDHESLLQGASPLAQLPPVGADDIAMLTYTSGTTGRPKGVMHRQAGVANMVLQQLIGRGLSPDDVWTTAAASSWMTVVLNLLGIGNGMTHVIPQGSFDVREFLRDIAQHRVTAAMLVPTLIARVLQEVRAAPGAHDLSSLRLLMYGSAPATPALIRQAYEVFGCEMVQSYGMTEAGWITQLTAADHRHAIAHEPSLLRSVGRPGVMAEVTVRSDTGELLPAGSTGTIWLRGESLMAGYRNLPQETAEVLQDGWLCTNDVGHLDARGYVYLTDRRKFMIISGAVNIFPSSVEAAVAEHPSVQEVAVVGVPHPEWGEAVVAVIRLRENTPRPAQHDLREHCAARLNAMERPKHFLFVEDFPRSVNGKVRKQDVKAWAAAQAAEFPWADARQPSNHKETA
jgi:acyl-CoA synthetase (AMP-forming)/AMP-acid ligase II